MKKKTTINNLKLGTFVLAGVVFLVYALYMIGQNKNLFGATFTLSTNFRNINGLVPGNNVRYAGIDVGTVQSINVENDTSVLVVMIIDVKMQRHIRSNAVASLGTDGLVGNKLVNINAMPGAYPPVEEGGIIASRIPVETDEMLRTLQTTNNNIAVITENLKQVSVRLNGSSTLWNILADTMIAMDLRSAVKHFAVAGSNTASATYTARQMMDRFSSGNGLANTVFRDTILSTKLSRSINGLQQTTQSLDTIALKLKDVVGGMKAGKGTIGILLSDTASARKFERSISNIEQGTGRFNENMEALKGNFLFRRYFRKHKPRDPDNK